MIDEQSDTSAELMRQASRLRFENPREAHRLYSDAVECSRRNGSRRKLIQALKGVGQIARDLRLNPAALGFYREAVELCRQEGDPLLLAHTVRHLGDIHQDMNHDNLAEPCYQEALTIYRSNPSTSTLDLANAVRPFAILQEAFGRVDEAKLLWAEARDLYAGANVDEGVKECARRLSRLEPIENRSMKAIFKRAVPYANDAMNLPVADVEAAIPFYEQTFNFRVVARHDTPHKSAILARDEIQIGLAENGGDPSQEGCYFEVDNIEAAFAEIKGRPHTESDLETQSRGDRTQRVFFVVAPDGLCYMLGQPILKAN